MHRGLLFDLDGVIVDTAEYHYLAWKEIAGQLGIPFTRKDNERLKGISRMDSLEILLNIGRRKLGQEESRLYCEEKNNIYLRYIRKMGKDGLLPGVLDFLHEADEIPSGAWFCQPKCGTDSGKAGIDRMFRHCHRRDKDFKSQA